MKLKLMSVFVDDQDKALKFYTDVLGFAKKLTLFFVADIQTEYARLKKLGATFTMEPTKTTGSTIAVLDDTCGNLIQITHLDW